MPNVLDEKRVTTTFVVADELETWCEAFLKAKRIEGKSNFTLTNYAQQLGHLRTFCAAQKIQFIQQLTPDTVRAFLTWMGEGGHNIGGQRGAHRVARALINWYISETESAIRNPFAHVPAPKQPEELLEPASLEDVGKMVKVCGDDALGVRDRAIILTLLDCGARARELLSLDRKDVDAVSGEITIRKGKGGKGRTVFVEKHTRQALRQYFRQRRDSNPAAFVSGDDNERLGYSGLRALLKRRARQAGVKPFGAHTLRRTFAIESLRAGADPVSVSRLLGHGSLEITKRYLKQVNEDLAAVHHRASPVERGMSK